MRFCVLCKSNLQEIAQQQVDLGLQRRRRRRAGTLARSARTPAGSATKWAAWRTSCPRRRRRTTRQTSTLKSATCPLASAVMSSPHAPPPALAIRELFNRIFHMLDCDFDARLRTIKLSCKLIAH
ncbi:MAG: hypothetical protein EP343_15230 [Deltaproteobacteria bacterium]|nr:MAG: hypothetical protein EP343_15230 [Deltaproteobacteria bacterium]